MLPEIKVNIGVDTDSLQKGLTDATNKLARFGKQAGAAIAVAGTGAAVGLAALTKAAIDNADALDNMSQRIGVSVEALSRLQYAAKLSDTSIESLQTGFRTLANNMVAGSDAFAKLGISITNTDGSMRSSVDIFSEIADRFAGMEDGALKSALAVDVFGRSGLDLIPMLNAGSAGLAEFGRQSDEFNYTISTKTAKAAAAFNDNLDKINAQLTGVANKVMEAVLPALTDLSTLIVNMNPDAVAIGAALIGIGTAAALAAPGVSALAGSLGLVAGAITAIAAVPGGLAVLAGGMVLGSTTSAGGGKSEREWEAENEKFIQNTLARNAAIEKLNADLANGAASGASVDPYAGFAFGNDGNIKLAAPSGLGTGGGGGTSGGGPAIDAERERIQARLDVIREGFLTENEMLTQKYADDEKLLNDALAKKLLNEEDHRSLVENLEKEHQDKLKALRSAEMQRNLDAVASIGNSIVSIMKSTGNKQIGLQKGIASASVAISTAAGVMKAIEQYGWPGGLLPAAAVAAEGMAQLASINSASASGSNGAGGVKGGGSAAAAEPAMNRTLTVQGITPGQIFSGDSMRDFMERMLEMQRDGYQVVLA
jgi:hypothetical protein